MKGVLSYVWVNMGRANCNDVSYFSCNLQCQQVEECTKYFAMNVVDSCHHIEQSNCANCVTYWTTAVWESRQLVGCPK